MPDYRRAKIAGGTFFFTVCSNLRRPILTSAPVRNSIRSAFSIVRSEYPFETNAWVLLPDHLHCIWTLPQGDSDYSKRWSKIKRLVTQGNFFSGMVRGCSRKSRNEGFIWQRRFWEHVIESERDYRIHVDYIHWNPVKHGYVSNVVSWEFSSFHRHVSEGIYDPDWGISESKFKGRIFGE